MKKDHFPTVQSIGILLLFVLMAVGSGPCAGYITKSEILSDGVTCVETTTTDEADEFERHLVSKKQGPRDSEGLWHGSVTEELFMLAPKEEKETGRIVGNYSHGERHGWFKQYNKNGELTKIAYYENNVYVEPQPPLDLPQTQPMGTTIAPESSFSPTPSYNRLERKRPWFIDEMELLGTTREQFNAFLFEIETHISSLNPGDEQGLGEAYNAAIEELEEGELYVELLSNFDFIRYREARDSAKRMEGRLAIFDRLIGGGGSTYGILQTSYPGFLQKMVAYGASLSGTEAFYNDFDARMDAKGPLDLMDPLVADVIDERILAVLEEMNSVFSPAPGLNDGTDDGSASAGKDAYAWGCDGVHSGSEEIMYGGVRSNCNQYRAKAYIQFNVDTLPASAQKVYLGVTHIPHDSYCNSMCNANFYFYPVLEAWNEITIGTGSMPAEGAPVFGPIPIAFPNNFGDKEYDITELYRGWKDGTIPNHGLAIYSPDVGCANASVMFGVYTSDSSQSKRPYLRFGEGSVTSALIIMASKRYTDSDAVYHAIKEWYWSINQPKVYVSPDGNCGTNTPCLTTVQAGIFRIYLGDDGAVVKTVVKIREGTYPENVVLSLPKKIELDSGCNASFSAYGSPSRIGKLEIRQGTIWLKGTTVIGP